MDFSSAEVMDIDDRYYTPHNQQYLVATSTKSRVRRCPPKATQSPNTMYIWTLSRYQRRFFIGFPSGGLEMLAKETIVERRRPDSTRIALVAAVRCF